MSDGVDAGMQPMEALASNPLLHGPFTPPGLQQLPPPHHPVLPRGKRSELAIVIASPRKPFSRDGFRGLDEHRLRLTENLARVARGLCDFNPLSEPKP